jgi:hypothetical protein
VRLVAAIAWKSCAQSFPDKNYLAVLIYLPLKTLSALPQFFYYAKGFNPN